MLKGELCGCPFYLFDTLGSTNDYIRENIAFLPDRCIVSADYQSEGKGRMGNSWQGSGDLLSFSVLLKNVTNPVNLTIICAVAVCRALNKLCPLDFGIKWTNDIICRGHKVCGILCESVLKGYTPGEKPTGNIICGIGVNVNQPVSFFERNNLPSGASLYSLTGKKYDKNMAAQYICGELFSLLDENFDKIIQVYKEKCITLGKRIMLIKDGERIEAFAKDLTASGCLVCENEGGTFIVSSGAVSVRGLDGRYI